jgi:hypothetical protein
MPWASVAKALSSYVPANALDQAKGKRGWLLTLVTTTWLLFDTTPKLAVPAKNSTVSTIPVGSTARA